MGVSSAFSYLSLKSAKQAFATVLELVQSYIDGEWRTPRGKRIPRVNPANEEVIHHVASATVSDLNSALSSSRKGFEEWSNIAMDLRAEVMRRISQLLPEKMDDVSRVITEENGKPIVESNMEVMGAQMYADYYAAESEELLKQETRVVDFPQVGNYEFRTVFQPLGVVVVIAPWNWPFLIPFQTILPALMAGNSVIFKPSSLTAMVGKKITEILVEAGLPEGVINLVQGGGEVGDRLVRSGVQAVVFVGGNQVGSKVAVNCAKGLKRAVLELGGSDPFIVFDDAQLDEAINGAIYGRFFGAGQICVSAKRIFVHNSIFEEFTTRFAEKAASLKVGNGVDPSTDMGPLVSKSQRSYVTKTVREAVSHGAKAICGGSSPPESDKGFFYLPTVLTNAKMSMKVMSEEMFGPVAPVLPFEDEVQAVQLANSTRYGLGASIWTRNEEKALRISRRIESGIVWINDVAVTFPHAPWGGVKESGVGRHSSKYGLLDMVNIRQICINKIREPTRMWWLPYSKG